MKDKEIIIKAITERIKEEQKKHERSIPDWHEIAARKIYTIIDQEDIVREIQLLIDVYKSDILRLEQEFRDTSSVLTVEKIVTLETVVYNLESKLNKQD
jgi:hypothetical protein